MRNYTPQDWYWIADDGRIFSSSRSKLIKGDDADFAAWTDTSGKPTVWPKDDAGAQTNAALQDVLTPYGLKISVK